jgi:hypothetical protein
LVSGEDSAELNLPHENGIRQVDKIVFRHDKKETKIVILFDLFKAVVWLCERIFRLKVRQRSSYD